MNEKLGAIGKVLEKGVDSGIGFWSLSVVVVALVISVGALYMNVELIKSESDFRQEMIGRVIEALIAQPPSQVEKDSLNETLKEISNRLDNLEKKISDQKDTSFDNLEVENDFA